MQSPRRRFVVLELVGNIKVPALLDGAVEGGGLCSHPFNNRVVNCFERLNLLNKLGQNDELLRLDHELEIGNIDRH